jgi:hypothetical protein
MFILGFLEMLSLAKGLAVEPLLAYDEDQLF